MVFRYNFFIYLLSGLIAAQCVSIHAVKKPSLKERAQDVDADISYDIASHDAAPSDNPPEYKKERTCNVRILLDEHDRSAKGSWDFESDEGFALSDELVPVRSMSHDDRVLTISHARGSLYLNGRRCTKKSCILFHVMEKSPMTIAAITAQC